jgi:hypothetical protein
MTCLILAGLLAGASFCFAVGAVAGGVVCSLLAVLNILRVGFLLRIGRKGASSWLRVMIVRLDRMLTM